MVIDSGFFGVGPDKILIVDDIASKEELGYIVYTAENMDIWDTVKQNYIWTNRVSDHEKLLRLAPDTFKLISEIQQRFMKKVSDFYGVRVSMPSPSIARWFVGNSQDPHADKVGFDEHEIGSIIYLNNDYDGGQIYFPQHEIELKPVAGNAIAFPGDEYYMHGVREVTGGLRYTLPIFWKVIKDA
jgi:hypothetical protein